MLLASGFNQLESYEAFSLAAHEDPTSAMAEWGMAYSLGPGANRCLPPCIQPNVQDMDTKLIYCFRYLKVCKRFLVLVPATRR